MSQFTATDFQRRAETHLAGSYGGFLDYGDYRANPGMSVIDNLNFRDAAVLVPVVDEPAGARMILTKRTDSMRKHSGQIAFPGGKLDPDDTDAASAALREAEEEIGLPRHFVEIVGTLPSFPVPTGFRITPVLSVVRPGFTLKPNPDEVDYVFDVPLSFLMDPDNYRLGRAQFSGRERNFYEIPYEGHRIWGITAGIIRSIYERFYE
ncbi:MAG: hypothetical protein RLZZ444_416 [Pseudomonadota bacterium]|jgi:8-oxo-dGTP pyrophosphatase MutT (NUDIX family)